MKAAETQNGVKYKRRAVAGLDWKPAMQKRCVPQHCL